MRTEADGQSNTVQLSAADPAALAALNRMESALRPSVGIVYSAHITLSGISASGATSLDVLATVEKPNKASFQVSPVGNACEQIYLDGSHVIVFDPGRLAYDVAPAATTLQGSMSSLYLASQAVYKKQPDAVNALTWLLTFPISYEQGQFAPGAASSDSTVDLTSRAAVSSGRPATVVSENYHMTKFKMILSISYTIDRLTSLPVELDEDSIMADGTVLTSIHQRFSDVKLLSTPQPPSTYTFSPPFGAAMLPAPNAAAGETKLNASALLNPGKSAPNFTVQAADGNHVSLTDYLGKVVVLDFWATWSAPSQISLTHTDAIASLYAPRGVVFLPICSGDDLSAFDVWVKQHTELTMPLYYDPAGRDKRAGVAQKLYGVTDLPTQYVIGKSGKVVAGIEGYDQYDDPGESRLSLAIGQALEGS